MLACGGGSAADAPIVPGRHAELALVLVVLVLVLRTAPESATTEHAAGQEA